MIKLAALIAHYEKRVMDATKNDNHGELEVLVSTLVHLSAYQQAHTMLERLAAGLPAKPAQEG